MPQAIPLVASAIATAAGATAITSAVITLTAAVAVGTYQSRRAERKARDAYNRSLQDRLITIRSGVSTRKYVLGTVRVGGTLMYADTIGENSIALDMVMAYAANMTQLVAWYLNDEYVDAASFPGPKYGGQKTHRGKKVAGLPAGSQNVTIDHTPVPGTVRAYSVRDGGDGGGGGGGIYDLLSASVSGTTVTVTVPAGGAKVDVSYDWISTADKLYSQFRSGLSYQTTTDWGGPYASPKWGASHRLRGTTYARTLMLWDENVYESGAPEVSLVLTGRGISPPDGTAGWDPYDPRSSAYVTTGTSNPALLAAWWMTVPRAHGGCGIPFDWIDWPSVAAAANVCDELITVRSLDIGAGGQGYEKIRRYECHTVLDTAASPLDNLDIILSAMAGRRAFTGGKYRIVAGSFRAATRTLTDDDVIGTKPLSATSYTSDDTPPNIVTATIADWRKKWQETSPPPVRNPAYIAADGAESPLDMQLPATTDQRHGNYLMGVALESARPATSVTVTVGGIGEDIALLDTLQLDISNRPQYSGTTFEVLGHTDHFDGTFDLTLREIRPNTYALDADRYTPIDPVLPPDLSYLWNVAPLTGWDVLDGQTSDGIEIAWDLHSQASVRQGGHIQLRYRKLGSDDWRDLPPADGDSVGTTLTLAVTKDETYEFQGRAVNGLGAVSAWSYEFVTVVAASGPALAFIGEFATPPDPASYAEGSVYRNSTDKDTYILRNGAWQLFLEGGEDGAPGTAKLLQLLTTSQVFQVSTTGVGTPVSITLTAQGQNLTGDPTFTILSGTVTGGLSGTGQTRTLNYAAMTSDAVVIEVTQDGQSDRVTVVKVRDGTDAIVSVLTNEAHTIAADYEGDVPSFAQAITFMKVYRGINDETASWTFSKIDSSGITSTLVTGGADRGKVSVTAMTADSAYVEITATRSGFPTQVKRFVLAKSKQGPVGLSGAAAKMLALSASSQVFQILKDGSNNPASITLTASAQNLTGALTWSVTPTGAATLTGTGSTRTLTFANMAQDAATITVSQDGQTDRITIVKLREGVDGTSGIAAFLTNEAQVLTASAAGAVSSYAAAAGNMRVYFGVADDTSAWTLTVGAKSPAGLAASITSAGAYSVTGGLATDDGWVDFVATKGTDSVTKRFTLSKSRAGDPGEAAKVLYVTASSQIVRVDGATLTPSSITLTAVTQNLSGTPTFAITSGTATLSGSGPTRTIATSSITSEAVTVTVTSAADGLSDLITIIKVREGQNGPPGIDADDPVFAVLTNEAHTVAADPAGNIVGSWSNVTTDMRVLIGVTDDTANWSFTRVNGAGVSSTINNTVGSPTRGRLTMSGMTGDSGTVEITATRSGFPTQTKVFTIAKSKQGQLGEGGRVLYVTATSQVVQVSASGVRTPSSITLTSVAQNLAGSPTWTLISGVATLVGSGNTRTISASTINTQSVTVQVSQDGLTDTITIVRVQEGAAGASSVVSLLTNEAHTLAADSLGIVSAGLPFTVDMDVYVGLADDTINWSFSAVTSGCTASVNNTVASSSRGRITVTAVSANTATVTVTATRSGYPAQVKTMTIAKSRQGVGGAPGPDGTRGSAHAYLSGYSTWNTTTQNAVNSYFQSTYGGRVINDMVTVYGGAFSQTRIWTGSAWGVVTQALDGTMLVDGSVPGSSLTSIASHAMSITPDPGFEDLSLWVLENGANRQGVAQGTQIFGRYYIAGSGPWSRVTSKLLTPISPRKKYRVSAWAWGTVGSTRPMYLFVAFYNAGGGPIAGTADHSGWPAVGNFHYYGRLGQVPPSSPTEYSLAFGSDGPVYVPAGAAYCRVGALLHESASGTGTNFVAGIRIQQLQDTELIAPNAATDVGTTSQFNTIAVPSGQNILAMSVTNDSDTPWKVSVSVSFSGDGHVPLDGGFGGIQEYYIRDGVTNHFLGRTSTNGTSTGDRRPVVFSGVASIDLPAQTTRTFGFYVNLITRTDVRSLSSVMRIEAIKR